MAFKRMTARKSAEELERESSEREKAIQALIAERIDKINILVNAGWLDDREHRFIESLHYASVCYGMQGLLGERLGELSEKQAKWLDGLYAKHCALYPGKSST